MIPVLVDYATPSAFESDRDRALVGMTANARRPVRFRGRLRRNVPLVRFALRAQLVDAVARRVLATRTFEALEQAPADDAYGEALLRFLSSNAGGLFRREKPVPPPLGPVSLKEQQQSRHDDKAPAFIDCPSSEQADVADPGC